MSEDKIVVTDYQRARKDLRKTIKQLEELDYFKRKPQAVEPTIQALCDATIDFALHYGDAVGINYWDADGFENELMKRVITSIQKMDG
jgi:hypothetical protein